MKIPFTASARTAMLIGAENFSNPEGAIIELVKNAYDADSPSCYILFDGENEHFSDIYIIDFEVVWIFRLLMIAGCRLVLTTSSRI